VIAISGDDHEKQVKFKASLKAPYHFIADSKGVIIKAFDVKMPLLTIAKRTTFVIGKGRKVLGKQEGNDALEPAGAVAACSIAPPEALKQVLGPKDGGSTP